MRVLHTIPSLDPRGGGPPEAVKHMVRALIARGVQAEIATSTHGFDLSLAKADGAVVDFEGLPVRFFPQAGWLRSYGWSTGWRSWLAKHARDYSVFHIHAVFAPWSSAGMRAARRAGVPHVVRPLGLLSPWSLQQQGRKKKLFLRWIDAANLRDAAGFHCTSAQEARDVEALMPPTRTWVIPHGVASPTRIATARDRLCQSIAANPADALLLFLGRLHPKKGLDLLINALATGQRRDFKLILAGEGEDGYVAELRRQAESAGIADLLRFVGFQAGHEKDLLLQGADLFVLTSHHENFALAALEALAAGTPVLLSEHVDLATTVREHSLGWVTSLTLASIAAALADFFAKRLPQPQFLSAAQQLMEQSYSWKHNAEEISFLYAKVVR